MKLFDEYTDVSMEDNVIELSDLASDFNDLNSLNDTMLSASMELRNLNTVSTFINELKKERVSISQPTLDSIRISLDNIGRNLGSMDSVSQIVPSVESLDMYGSAETLTYVEEGIGEFFNKLYDKLSLAVKRFGNLLKEIGDKISFAKKRFLGKIKDLRSKINSGGVNNIQTEKLIKQSSYKKFNLINGKLTSSSVLNTMMATHNANKDMDKLSHDVTDAYNWVYRNISKSLSIIEDSDKKEYDIEEIFKEATGNDKDAHIFKTVLGFSLNFKDDFRIDLKDIPIFGNKVLRVPAKQTKEILTTEYADIVKIGSKKDIVKSGSKKDIVSAEMANKQDLLKILDVCEELVNKDLESNKKAALINLQLLGTGIEGLLAGLTPAVPIIGLIYIIADTNRWALKVGYQWAIDFLTHLLVRYNALVTAKMNTDIDAVAVALKYVEEFA